jgi:hypothetical protein
MVYDYELEGKVLNISYLSLRGIDTESLGYLGYLYSKALLIKDKNKL